MTGPPGERFANLFLFLTHVCDHTRETSLQRPFPQEQACHHEGLRNLAAAQRPLGLRQCEPSQSQVILFYSHRRVASRGRWDRPLGSGTVLRMKAIRRTQPPSSLAGVCSKTDLQKKLMWRSKAWPGASAASMWNPGQPRVFPGMAMLAAYTPMFPRLQGEGLLPGEQHSKCH